MKILFSLLIVFTIGNAFGQQQSVTQSTERYFGQCLFTITDQVELDALQVEMLQNPNIELVRLDMNTQRAFIISSLMTGLTEQDFTSWFGVYSSTLTCVQVGIHGVDEIDVYPFTNCQN